MKKKIIAMLVLAVMVITIANPVSFAACEVLAWKYTGREPAYCSTPVCHASSGIVTQYWRETWKADCGGSNYTKETIVASGCCTNP